MAVPSSFPRNKPRLPIAPRFSPGITRWRISKSCALASSRPTGSSNWARAWASSRASPTKSSRTNPSCRDRGESLLHSHPAPEPRFERVWFSHRELRRQPPARSHVSCEPGGDCRQFAASQDRPALRVPARSLAELDARYGPFATLIMDIEGAELETFENSRDLLRKYGW